MNKFPQVLLLGNGINRAYNGKSWSELLLSIAKNEKAKIWLENKVVIAPMPLQAIMLTNNNVEKTIKDKKSDYFGGIRQKEQAKLLSTLLTLGFNDILTTNYSYELEQVNEKNYLINESKLKTMMKSFARKAEGKYLLKTYNEVKCDNVINRVWHIHGEARKPSSMILGHYLYGNLLTRIKEHADKHSYWYNTFDYMNTEIKSWVDSFIIGDVYILGMGGDFSEFDFWWLLNRKFNENANHGKLYFYEPKLSPTDIKYQATQEKLELLKIFNVDVIDLNCVAKTSNDYINFYKKAINHIKIKVQGK